MQLTHYTDYGLRVLMLLALQPDRRLITISEVAGHFQIPRNHLVKVVQRLGKLGYLRTLRGKGGGLRLARDPGDIVVGQVVRDLEPRLDVVDCGKPPCPVAGACALKGVFDQALQAFLDVLDRHTLAELTAHPEQLRGLLRWPVAATQATH